MARSRRKQASSAWQRRNERARAAGFRNYYEQRIRGGAAASPDDPRPTGRALEQARGHGLDRARERLLGYLEPGDEVMLADHIRFIDKRGNRYGPIEIQVVPEGPERDVELFTLPPLTRAMILGLVDDIADQDAFFTAASSLDVRSLVAGA